jgi:protein involved in polysaccharide export with SLBB domain
VVVVQEPSIKTESRSENNAATSTIPATKTVAPLTNRSEFEEFVEDAAGQPLAVYGRKLFDDVPTTFAPVDGVPVPANYVIGPGDELLIRIWGKIDADLDLMVDRNGQISVPKVGTLTVAGLRYEQLEGYLRSSVSALYKDFELNVTLGQLRTIQVFVLGNARQPGSYTLGSLSTLVNALFASGGPSEIGSMRNIQLRRDGKVVTEFDIYDLQQRGDKSHDVQLLPGDVIYIPTIGPQVAIFGDVNNPAIYELKGETTIAAALQDASGLTSLAGVDRVQLERIENHRRRHIDEFALDAPGAQRVLKDGDLLRIFPISPKIEDAVTLKGNVAEPGRYLWHQGMRISDLIASRDVLITRNYWDRQNSLTTWSRTDLISGISQNRQTESSQTDQTSGMNQNRRTGSSQISPSSGITQNPQTGSSQTSQSSGITQNRQTGSSQADLISDITQKSAEINWNYAVIERLDDHDLTTRLIPFNLGNAIDAAASSDNLLLKSGDVITVFSQNDLPLPLEKKTTFVRISGEVKAPGLYRMDLGDTLRSLVEKAGGLTQHSYLYGSVLTRASVLNSQTKQLQQSIDEMNKELLARYVNASQSTSEKSSDQQAQLNTQQALIARLEAAKPTGRVVLNLKSNASTTAEIPDITLEDGDSFYIPPKLSTVQVIGAVYNSGAFRYEEKRSLSKYLDDAGGAKREADAKRIYLIRADGRVISKQSHNQFWGGDFGKLALLPGDAIVVPMKIKSPGGFWNVFPQVTQSLSQTALVGAVVGTY